MRVRPAAVAAAVLLATSGCGSDTPDVAAAIVAVESSGCGLGVSRSVGFVVGPSLVVTVAHSVAGAGEVQVDGSEAQVAALDLRADVAVLRVAGVSTRARLGEPADGAPVSVILPDGAVASTVVSTPTIEHRVVNRGVTYQRQGAILDLAVEPGQSGSPVVNASGEIVAMVYARSTESSARSYAVAASEIESVLADVGDTAVSTGPC